MNAKKVLISILLASTFFISACVYIVLPEGLEETSGSGREDLGWAGLVTSVGEAEGGGLRVDITIRNDTGDWNSMRAADDKPALLTAEDGETINCDTVYVGTGGHRVAHGFQLRGYTKEEDGQPVTQLLYVECAGAATASGATLTIDTISFTGAIDYYVEIEESNKVEGKLELKLDEVVSDLTYPVSSPIEGLVREAGAPITGLSDNVVSLLDVQRSAEGFQFTWQNTNPSKFALKTHIGIPPVIGDDGIIYGVYETMDMPEVPLTPATGSVEWTTEVAVPQDVGGLYILLGVESEKPRTYLFYVLDITDK
ncbi:MAG: hypothetical protein A2W36_00565 [Chloroflexi bacterium RBG_16_58_14]|nr:MAG: hypothetical protein A2W36_00565 [Chloroflexi bacterium RBG_16_58_14]